MYVPAVTCYTAAHEMLSKFSRSAMHVQVHCATAIAEVGIARSLARSSARGRLREAHLRGGDAAAACEMEAKEKKVLDWLLS